MTRPARQMLAWRSAPLSSISRVRRQNAALRALIDELLLQVRGAQRENEAWTPAERAEAEAALARIMSRVRSAAVERPDEPDESP